MSDTTIYPIHIEGDPMLKQKCEAVTKDYPDLKNIIKGMFATLDATKIGVGMAASQIGIPIRVFILGGALPELKGVFINPEIIEFRGAQRRDWESCLSVPKIGARVLRWQKVKVKYYDEDFNEHTGVFKGFSARIIQHEYDHLLGLEFYDRISKEDLAEIIEDIKRLREGKFPDLDYAVKYHFKTTTP